MTSSAFSPSSPLTGTDPSINRRRSQEPLHRGHLSPAYLAKIREDDELGLSAAQTPPVMVSGSTSSSSNPIGLFEAEYSPITTSFPLSGRGRRTVSGNRDLSIRAGNTSVSRRLSLLSLRRWILNPLAISTGRPYLRSLSTLFIWLLTLWTFTRYVTPPEPNQSTSQYWFNSSLSWISVFKGDDTDTKPTTFFPEPPLRPADTYNSPNPLYRPLRPLDQPGSPFPRLRPTRFLPPKCLESWFANGEIMCGRNELGPEDMLDVTWLWVNGSDPRWQKDMIRVRTEKGIYSPEHHFRENNELLYSMRSVLQNLPGRLRTFHLITSDTPFNSDEDMGLLSHRAIQELEDAADKEFKPSAEQKRLLLEAGLDLSDRHTVRSAFSLRARKAAGAAMPDHYVHAQSEPDIPVVSDKLKVWLNSTWRVAQTPAWLSFDKIDLSSPKHPLHHLYTNPTESKPADAAHLYFNSHPSLKYAVHSEIFHLPSRLGSGKNTAADLEKHLLRENEWRQKALPNFNSMAIESRIGFLWGLGDVSLSFNDDFFILKPHAVSDFFSPLYGTVIRFDQGFYQQVKPLLDKAWINDAGEVGGLYHANWLLSQRFPRRLRPYFAHVPKVITRGLHHEASLMFEDALTAAGERQFRELPIGEGNVQMQWLLTALRVERWREALLWTWVVGKVGTAPQWQPAESGQYLGGTVGIWGEEARAEIEELFGLNQEDTDVIKIEIHRGERWTLEEERMKSHFEGAGWEPPKATEFLFSSMDGHMPPILRPSQSPSTNDRCTFDLERCLGSFWSRQEDVSADDMFKRLAFANPSCGDCLIMALVTASGPLGLSAVFPPPEATFVNNVKADPKTVEYLPPPHLPLTTTWQEADFSLENVMSETSLPQEEVNLREWSMKLLSRYLYMSGKSNSHFHMAKSPKHVKGVFKSIDSNKDVSLLGFNDDIEEDYETTRDLMLTWFQSRWPDKMIWERN